MANPTNSNTTPTNDSDPKPSRTTGTIRNDSRKPATTSFIATNQTRQDWGDADTVTTLLERFDIEPTDVTITTLGGFTGEFSEALREVGCNVVFTDPMDEWVELARENGFEAVQCAAGTLSTDILQRSDAVATFECYFPLSPSSAVYSTLRLLTTPHGLLFAESDATRESMRGDGAERTFLSTLSPYIDIYGTERGYRETDSLRIYQDHHPAESRTLLVESAAGSSRALRARGKG